MPDIVDGPAISDAAHPANGAHQAAACAQAPAFLQGQQQQLFKRPKLEDALGYLDEVKYKFRKRPRVYLKFLDIMKEFKNRSIDTPGVVIRVMNLFAGHPELLERFNIFLPPGYKITLEANEHVKFDALGSTVLIASPSSSVPSINSLDATSSLIKASMDSQCNATKYLDKIKDRFRGQPDVYVRFLEILHSYSKQQRDIQRGVIAPTQPLTKLEVHDRVAILFQNQDDLIEEFYSFLINDTGAFCSDVDNLRLP